MNVEASLIDSLPSVEPYDGPDPLYREDDWVMLRESRKIVRIVSSYLSITPCDGWLYTVASNEPWPPSRKGFRLPGDKSVMGWVEERLLQPLEAGAIPVIMAQ